MSEQKEIAMHEQTKRYQASLGCAELRRRNHLVAQANVLIGSLITRAAVFHAADDAEQVQRSLDALARATRRAKRREMAYYGA